MSSKDATTLVEESWATASANADFTDVFYNRLFTIRPDFKTTLFARTNVKAQSKMLYSMLDVAVKNLRSPDVLVPALTELGVRHCRYGVRPEHYGAVAEALLWTLEKFVGRKWTPETKAAWVGVYTTVQTVMVAPCETEEGKRMLADYDAKYGTAPAKDTTTLVEESWSTASANADFTDVFYNRLFTIRPDFKTTLFARTNVKAQSKMLYSMLDVAVKNLRNPDVLVPALTELGVRHCRYGVRPEHYGAVAEALLWTLEKFVGRKWTPETKAAWVGVYTTIQKVMVAECETEDGKRMLAEYDAKYGKAPVTTSKLSPLVLTTLAIAAAGIATVVMVGAIRVGRAK